MTDQTMKDLRILLLEDDPAEVEEVTRALERTNPTWVVQSVGTRDEYAAALESFAPDVILSDHSLGELDSLEALRMAQRSRPGSPFLIVSASCEPSVFEGLKAGAANFVEKSDQARLGPAIIEALEARAPLRRLSNRQLEVLQLLTSGSSTRTIAERLHLSVKTVETHRAQVMKRLGIRDLAGLVRFSIHVGLVSAAA